MKTLALLATCIIAPFLTSCGTTSAASAIPPFKLKGNVKGQDVEVTIYPDGSKPTEIVVNGDPGAPIELDLN